MSTAGRKLRAESGVAPAKLKQFIVSAPDAEQAERLRRDVTSLKKWLQAETVDIVVGEERKGMPAAMTILGTVYLPLQLVDVAGETARLQGELEKTRGFLRTVEAKLANPGFVAKAPPALVEQQKTKAGELRATIERLEKLALALAKTG